MNSNIFTTSNTYKWMIPSSYVSNTIEMNFSVSDSAGWTANSVQSGTLTVSSGGTCIPVLSNTVILFSNAVATGYVPAGSYAPTTNDVNVIDSGSSGGNLLVDASSSGTNGNWISTAGSFLVGNTLWSQSSGSNTGNQLTNTVTGYNTKIPVLASGGNDIYFGLNVPKGQAAGTYNQVITVLFSC